MSYGLLRTESLSRLRQFARYNRAFLLDNYRSELSGRRWVIPDPGRGPARPVTEHAFVPGPGVVPALKSGMAQAVVRVCAGYERVASLPLVNHRATAAELRDITAGIGESAAYPNPVLWTVLWHITRSDAQQRLIRLALAASEHRERTGEFPESLDDLAPYFPDGVPVDPYTDKPFIIYDRTPQSLDLGSAAYAGDPCWGISFVPESELREDGLILELR